MIENKIKSKKGDIQLSFGMIFSIIIIIATISVAIYSITLFMQNAEKIKFNLAVKEIQEEVIYARTGQEADKIISVSTPKGIEMLCFYNSSERAGGSNSKVGEEIKNDISFDEKFNLYFYPLDIPQKYSSDTGWRIKCSEYEDVNCLSFSNNPFCIIVNNGVAKIRIINKGNYDGIINIQQG